MGRSISDISNVLTGGLRGNTSQETKWLASAPPEMRGQMEAQLQMQHEQELIQMVNQMSKALDEASKTLTRNIGA